MKFDSAKQNNYRYCIIAIDKTIRKDLPNKVLWQFENNKDRIDFIGMVYRNGNYDDIQLIEIDRALQFDKQ